MRLGSLVLACSVSCCVVACEPGSDMESMAPGGPQAPSATADPASLSTCIGSTNPVDVAACPTLERATCAAAPASSTVELCRRLHLDLTGAAPTEDEIGATCAGKTPREIATALMATPAYVKHAQELWGEILAFDPAQVEGKWLADVDDLVARLVRGEMGYDAFTIRTLGHPVFGVGARFPRSDVVEDDTRFYPQVARHAFEVFLGRTPIAGEEESLSKLFSPWRKSIRILNGDYGRADPLIDPSACPCESTLFGVPTRIVIPVDRTRAYGVVRERDDLRAELDKVGKLFVEQRAYWSQAANLALAMYLGWWKTTPDVDASFIAEVALTLGERLRASTSRSWRDLVLDVVTSTLYVRSNRVDPSARDDLPVYCAGPFRMLRPEAYVASLGKVLGVRVGRCDHRTYERRGSFYPDGSEGSFFPDALREDEPSDAAALGTVDYHWLASTGMGGCSAGAKRSEEPNLTMVFGAAPVAIDLCMASDAVLPESVAPSDRSDAAVEAIAGHLSKLLLHRDFTAMEKAAVVADARACVTQSSSCTAQKIAIDMCAAIARSTELVTY